MALSLFSYVVTVHATDPSLIYLLVISISAQ